MKTIQKFMENNKSQAHNCNYSDEELILKELCSRCRTLEMEKLKINSTNEDWITVNDKNESISKSLKKIKTDYESYKSHLCKTLYNLNISTDKQRLLLRKKSDEYFEKRKNFEAYCKVSPVKYELEKLISINRILEKDWQDEVDLYELTKRQYYELLNLIVKTFKNKVCEFCDAVLRLKTDNNLVN